MKEIRKEFEKVIRTASKHTHNSTEWFDYSLWEEGECPNIEWILSKLEEVFTRNEGAVYMIIDGQIKRAPIASIEFGKSGPVINLAEGFPVNPTC